MKSHTISVLPSEFGRGEKKIKEALAENHLEAALPKGLGDYLISNIQASTPYVSYRNEMTVEEVIKILGHYDIVPMDVWKGTFTHHLPDGRVPNNDRQALFRGTTQAELRVDYVTQKGKGRSRAGLDLFVRPRSETETHKILRLNFYLKWDEKRFAVNPVPQRDRAGNITSYQFHRSPTLAGLSRLQYGSYNVANPNWECQHSYLIDNILEWKP